MLAKIYGPIAANETAFRSNEALVGIHSAVAILNIDMIKIHIIIKKPRKVLIDLNSFSSYNCRLAVKIGDIWSFLLAISRASLFYAPSISPNSILYELYVRIRSSMFIQDAPRCRIYPKSGSYLHQKCVIDANLGSYLHLFT